MYSISEREQLEQVQQQLSTAKKIICTWNFVSNTISIVVTSCILHCVSHILPHQFPPRVWGEQCCQVLELRRPYSALCKSRI